MPLHDIHKRKKAKNYAVLAVILTAMATFFFVTIVKFQESHQHVPAPVQPKEQ
jgi:hypothetical protein